MLLAALGDVHGNLPALEAVLFAIEEEGIETIVNTGDLVMGMPFAAEVVELVRQRGIPSVQGEMDRIAAAFVRKGKAIAAKYSALEVDHLRWTHEHMPSADIEFVRRLPKQQTLRVDGCPIFLCHGTPSGQTDSLKESESLDRFRRQREIANTDIIVCGRTHRAFARMVDGTLFVNPGSVGVQMGTADYAVVSTEEEPWSAEIRSVTYDTRVLLERMRDAELEPLWV